MPDSSKKPTTPPSTILPSIQAPKAHLLIKGRLRQIFLHNPRVNYLMFAFLAFSIYLIFLVSFIPQSFIFVGVVVLYFLLVLIDFPGRRIILDEQNVIRKGRFTTHTYPYHDINKIILVRDLTHYDGRYKPRTNGMALLLFTTSGNIPGFPFFELGHQSYMTPDDLLKVFNAFSPSAQIEIQQASRSDILNMIGDLRQGILPNLPPKQS